MGTPVAPSDTTEQAIAGSSVRPSLIQLGWVLVIFLASRLVQLALLIWMTQDGTSLRGHLLAWDGGWWVRVATQGYPHGYTYDGAGDMLGNGLAFFPLYPALIRLVAALGVDPGSAALVISSVAAAVACVLLFMLGTALKDRRVGYALVALFCAQPMSVVLSMGYSEALFSMLVIGMLVAAHRGYWLTAGLLGFGAGLTRPTGLAAALALGVAAVLAVRDRRRTGAGAPAWRPVLAALLALSAVPAFLLWVGLRVGQLDAWFTIQTAGWGTTTDFGSATLRFVLTALRQGDGFVQISVALLLIVAVIAAVLATVRRTWLPLTVYGLITVGLVIGQAGYYHSKPRLLVPALLVLVPAALAAGRARTRTAVLGLIGYAAFGLWYGSYLLTIWHFTI